MCARAFCKKNTTFQVFTFKLGLIQKKSSMPYIKLKPNWDTEFISDVKILTGALVTFCVILL